ncbi:MAG: 4Fe-4S binding protein [Mariniphaga sp.]
MKLSVQSKRYLIIIFGIVIFLPPIALLPRVFGSMSICGSPFCMRMLFSIEGFSAMSKVLFMGVFMLIVIFSISFFAGRFFCSHLCPIGGATELGSKIVPQKFKIDYTWISAPAVRYSYLIAFLILPVLGVGSICCSYCNFSIISSLFDSITSPASRILALTFGGIINLTMIILLGFLAVGGRAYCNFLCPIGAIDGIFNWLGSKLSFFKRIRIDKTKCSACSQCINECPVWAIEKVADNSMKINQTSCITCKLCISKCPAKAISYRTD